MVPSGLAAGEVADEEAPFQAPSGNGAAAGHPGRPAHQQPPRTVTFDDSEDLDVPDFLK
jgi:cell division protein FtsZ